MNIRIAKAAARDCRHRVNAGAQLIGKLFEILAHDFRTRAQHQLLLRRLAVLDRRELDVDVREIDYLLLAAPDRYQCVGNAGKLAHVSGNALAECRSRRKRRTFGRAHVDFELRLIVDGQKVLTDEHEQRYRADNHQNRQQHDGPTMRHGPFEQRRVGAIDGTVEARFFGSCLNIFVLELRQRSALFSVRR